MSYFPLGKKEVWIPDPMYWEDTGVVAPVSRTCVFRVGTTLYMFGGATAASSFATSTTKIYSATYDATGTTPVFGYASADVPTAILGGRICLIGNTLYMIGAIDGTSANPQAIWNAPVSTPTVWTNQGNTLLGETRNNAPIVVANGSVSLLGGYSGAAGYASVRLTSSANPLAGWANQTLNAAIWEAAGMTKNGQVWMLGGYNTGTNSDIRVAPTEKFCVTTAYGAFVWGLGGALPAGITQSPLVFDCGEEFVVPAISGTSNMLIGRVLAGHLKAQVRTGITPAAGYAAGSGWIGGDGRAYYIKASDGRIIRSERRKVFVQAMDYEAALVLGPYVGYRAKLADGSPASVSPHVLMGVAPWQVERTAAF